MISRRERGTGEKTQSDREVLLPIDIGAEFSKRVVSEIFIRYTKRNLVLKSKTCVSSYRRFTCYTNIGTDV